MKINRLFYIAFTVIVLSACDGKENLSSSPNRPNPSLKTVSIDQNFQIVSSQTIYVPIYSHIYHQNRRQKLYLAATLSIRNTDLDNPLVVTSVRYYDSAGKLVRSYIDTPIEIGALASTDFFVDSSDSTGGSGANFIVEWVAQRQIAQPVVEAVAIGTSSQQGISFISPGRVIKTRQPPTPKTGS